MPDKELTDQQEQFCHEYLVDLNATQAAIRAGYSKNGANSKGSQLLAVVSIQDRISELKAARLERVQCDADYMLTRLMQEAEADLADLYADDGSMRPIQEWPLIWRQGLVAGLDVQQLLIGDEKEIGQIVKAKLSDRTKRLEMLGRHIGFFNDKLTLTGADGGPVKWEVTAVETHAG